MVDEFIELNEKLCLPNALMRMESQEVKFDDFRSKCGIPGGTPKNNITGSYKAPQPSEKSPSPNCTLQPVITKISEKSTELFPLISGPARVLITPNIP